MVNTVSFRKVVKFGLCYIANAILRSSVPSFNDSRWISYQYVPHRGQNDFKMALGILFMVP